MGDSRFTSYNPMSSVSSGMGNYSVPPETYRGPFWKNVCVFKLQDVSQPNVKRAKKREASIMKHVNPVLCLRGLSLDYVGHTLLH